MKSRPPTRRPPPTAPDPAPATRSKPRVERLPDALLAGVVALLVATPLIPSEATSEGLQTPLNVLGLLLLLGWGVGLLLRGNGRLRLGWTEAAIAGLVTWHVVSGLVVGLAGNGRQSLNLIWQWVAYGVLVWLLRQLVRSPQQGRGVAAVMIALGVLLSGHAYYQYFYSHPQMRELYARNPERMLAENGLPVDAASPARQLFESRVRSTEPLATFALTNSLAGYLAPWLVFVLGIALLQGSAGRYRQILGPLLIALALGGCLLLTKSRTGILATSGAVVLLGLFGRRSGWRLDWKIPTAVVAVAGLLTLVAVFVGGLDAQVLSEAPLSVRYRLEYWRATAAMIVDHPLFGSGPGNFQEYYAHYKLPSASEMIKDPHNFVLEIWATAGTPAVLLLFAAMAAFVYDLRRGTLPREQAREEILSPDHRVTQPPASELSGKETLAWIYGGGVLGLLLAYPLGLLVGYPPELTAILLPLQAHLEMPVIWLVGLPLAALALWLLHGWVVEGELPVWLPVIALIGLLVNLLAAGAASFPGVVNTAWVLLTVALLPRQFAEGLFRLAPRWSAVVVVGILGLLFAYIFTQYQPVLNSRTHLLEGQAHQMLGRLDAAEASYVASATADPWAAEPLRKIAELRLQRWMASPSAGRWRQFESAADAFLERSPQYFGQYETVAKWQQLAASRQPQDSFAERSLTMLERAVELYPNGAMLRAELAWALHRTGREAEAATAAAEALRLDALHAHREHKLSALHLFDPGGEQVTESDLRPETAEQTMQKLRNASGR